MTAVAVAPHDLEFGLAGNLIRGLQADCRLNGKRKRCGIGAREHGATIGIGCGGGDVEDHGRGFVKGKRAPTKWVPRPELGENDLETSFVGVIVRLQSAPAQRWPPIQRRFPTRRK